MLHLVCHPTTRLSSIVTGMPQLAWRKRRIAVVSVMRDGAFERRSRGHADDCAAPTGSIPQRQVDAVRPRRIGLLSSLMVAVELEKPYHVWQ